MPACFQLYPIGSTEPTTLQSVDEAMCEHFKAKCDPVNWYHWWYDSIGFKLATGKTFDEIIAFYKKEEEISDSNSYFHHMVEIAEWLKANYTTESWTEIGRR